MEPALIAKLLVSAGVTALVSTRINWGRRPQGSPLPCVVLTRVDGSPDVHHGGRSGLVQSRVQVDCWGVSYGAAKAVARAVETAVTAQTFTQGTIRFDVILIADERDSTFDEITPLFRTSLDLMVQSANAS
ncbi:DUF3168 domain-containing protein [Brevundimonas sp. TWP2-3-4b1]|uniref:DUF3168 domain-containing protein n=1 Tax=Brevundimonas sp. TWP2-3-4b1 TaxID=2804580 RepID=UPI003CF172F0